MRFCKNTTCFLASSLVFCLTLSLIGCGGGGEVTKPSTRRIIVLTNGNSPYWDATAAGANEAAKKLNLESQGLQVVIDRNDFSVDGQLDKLKQYLGATDIVGVAISITDPRNQALVKQLSELQNSGVKVITIDSDIDRTNERARKARFAYLGTDNEVAGEELGKAAKALKPEGGKFATFVGVKTAATAIGRIKGFQTGAGESFEQLESMGDQGSADKAKKNVRDSLDRHDNLDVLVGIWSYNTPAMVSIVDELNLHEKLTLIGFDADPPSITAMAEGKLDAMLVQDPYQMGYQGVELLKAMLDNNDAEIKKILPNLGQADGDISETGLKLVVPNTDSPIKADIFAAGTQYLTLDEFKEWLKKYNLTGS